MARADHSTSPRLSRGAAIAALVAAVSLLLFPALAFAEAAVDEYSLGPVGGQGGTSSDVQQDPAAESKSIPEQLGVVGENVPAESPLDAAGTVVWIVVGALALGGIATVSLSLRRGDES